MPLQLKVNAKLILAMTYPAKPFSLEFSYAWVSCFIATIIIFFIPPTQSVSRHESGTSSYSTYQVCTHAARAGSQLVYLPRGKHLIRSILPHTLAEQQIDTSISCPSVLELFRKSLHFSFNLQLKKMSSAPEHLC